MTIPPLPIPRTPLSMTYHSTIAEYRDEMHHDLEQAYRRFAIDGTLAWLASAPVASKVPLPTSAQVRDATEAVDLAAYRRRHDGVSVDLKCALEHFFLLLAPVLIEELVKGVDAPDQRDRTSENPHFLSLLYHLFYSREFRTRADGKSLFAENYDTDGVGPAWDAVRALIMGEPRDLAAVPDHVRTLCRKLNEDFRESIWPLTW